MEEEQKIIKIKVGEVYIDGKSHGVFQTAWQTKSKTGKVYYEMRTPMFPNVVKKNIKSVQQPVQEESVQDVACDL